MSSNPWLVESILEFYTLECPECDFTNKNETDFQNHAIENHPLSFAFFGKSEDITIEDNEIFDDFKKVNRKIDNSSDEDLVFEDNSGENKSKVWNHFLLNKKHSLAKCKHCLISLKVSSGSTKGLHKHLESKHSITETKLNYQSRENDKSTTESKNEDYLKNSFDNELT